MTTFSSVKDGEQAPERNARGRILSQTKDAIRSRLFRKEHAETWEHRRFRRKKLDRRKNATALLETRTLRPEFKDRSDEFINEYVECSDLVAVKSKWFHQDS